MSSSIRYAASSATFGNIGIAWHRLVQRHVQAMRQQRDVRALLALDDDQLKDIGLTRGQVESFIAGRSKHHASIRPIAATR